MFLQLLANGLVTGSVIAIAAVGVSLVYEILRIVNFAHGDYLAFGTFVGVAANVRYGERMLVATIAAIAAPTALLALAFEFALWRPMRRRGAGFMSLFITSIGLALLLRHVLFLVAGAEPRSYAIDPFKVYVIGVRLGGSGHRARRRGERDRARRLAARPHRSRPQDACARERPRSPRSRA